MLFYIDGVVNVYVLSGCVIDKKGNYFIFSFINIYVIGVNINCINSIIFLNLVILLVNGISCSII